MSVRLSTAGMTLQYCVETSAGERPTSGYTTIPEVKSMPSFNPVPNTIDTTTLQETEYMTSVPALKDLGGALEYGANYTEELITVWETLLEAHKAAALEGKGTWFAIVHPNLTKAIYFKGIPVPFGLNEAGVNGALETTLYITPDSEPETAAKPT